MPEFTDEFSEQHYYDTYYDSVISEQPMPLTNCESYGRLTPSPDMNMYYPQVKQYNSVQYCAPTELGYQPYSSDIQNTNSTTYSYQNLRK